MITDHTVSLVTDLVEYVVQRALTVGNTAGCKGDADHGLVGYIVCIDFGNGDKLFTM